MDPVSLGSLAWSSAEQARARLSTERPLSVVSVGDMPYERDAAHGVAEPDDTVKTIKFLEDPTLRELQQIAPAAWRLDADAVWDEADRRVHAADTKEAHSATAECNRADGRALA